MRFYYVSAGILSWQDTVIWLKDDHLNSLIADSFMFDLAQDTLDHITWLE